MAAVKNYTEAEMKDLHNLIECSCELDETTKIYLEAALNFTRVYKENIDTHPAIQEGLCLAQQYPALFRKMDDHHIFAGRRLYRPIAGFSNELNANTQLPFLTDTPEYECTAEDLNLKAKLAISNSGFCHNHCEMSDTAEKLPDSGPLKAAVLDMQEFWMEHSTRSHYNRMLPDDVREHTSRTTGFDTRFISGFMRQDCFSLDYDKLLQLGIPGLKSLISEKMKNPDSSDAQPEVYQGMLLALDVLVSVIDYYANEFRQAAEKTSNPERKTELGVMVQTLQNIRDNKPATLREAIQLFWLYCLIADSPNYGRMDVYLGDFYCRDIDNGVITENQAKRLLCGLWKIISEVKPEGGPTQPNARLVVGGMGRRNEKNADRFALAVMDVILEMRVNEPNVTLRFHKGQDEKLFSRALDLIGEGCVHPGLYSDDEHVPMVRKWFNLPQEDAEQYLPEGCGELLIDHMGFGSPNNIMVYPSGLDLVLHNGFDTIAGEQRGLTLGNTSDFDTFDKLLNAFKRQIQFGLETLAKRHAIEHKTESEKITCLFMSMLTDDCISSGRGLFDGGVRYLGGIIETFGLTSVANSLTAIKKLVYEDQAMTLEEMVDMLDTNFEGHEKQQKMMLNCPKFGNDIAEVDDLHTELSNTFNQYANEAGHDEGLDFFLCCNLNPGGIYYSEQVKASADGRCDREGLALGNAPTPGTDTESITALLNSMSKHTKGHAGYVHNLKLSKNMFKPDTRPKIEAIFKTFFENGGEQLMVTALNKGDLEAALKEPEKHRHVQVRVAGWTATFVDLPEKYQKQILKRTMYF